MADKPKTISKRFQRSDLAQFLPTPRLIKEFDAISADIVETLPNAIADIASDSSTVLAVSAFQAPPPQLTMPVLVDATAHILANQIFGA